MNMFFQSDLHFRHSLMCNQRGFNTVEEMNETLIQAHNSIVTDKDMVWMLGDIGFGRFSEIEKLVKRLKGHKNLISVNHCQRYRNDYAKSGLFESVQDFKEIKIDSQKILLFHYPILSWASCYYGAWNLHGHQHCNGIFDPNINRLDVGVDGRKDFSPYEFEEIKSIFDNPIDFQYYKHTPTDTDK